MIDINELRDRAVTFGSDYLTDEEWVAVIDRLEAAEKERDELRAAVRHEADCVEAAKAEIKALRAKIEAMEKRLRLILEEPENTMSNSKAMREMLRQARLALEESK